MLILINYPEVEDKDENNQNGRNECNNCGKQHNSECYLERIEKKTCVDWHEKTVHEELRHFSCQNCNAVFGAKETLEKHISERHLGRIKNKSCDVCGKSFNQERNVERHKKTVHEKIRNFSCPHCRIAAFGAKQTLKKHMLKCATNQFENSSKFLSTARK